MVTYIFWDMILVLLVPATDHAYESSPRNPFIEQTSTSNKANVGAVESWQNQPYVYENTPTRGKNTTSNGASRGFWLIPHTFPSHVFPRNNTNAPVEWSTASNESLFSIYM
ncbi:hypothetical protein TanjilG_13274 [Lupinus angustifolius]|uniref:Uncharacterized protein n=1 Tax=Lupinus angustifolius TaxID=3871 RepID=A0A4P1RUQ0_LUPAN|nr:hypothetical protein TanjilG_13274 [Lupinus angustifolius]